MTTCAYRDCKRTRYRYPHLTFFHFPSNENRRKQWLENCGNASLYELTAEQLRSRTICQLHFEERYFSNALKKRLVFNAVPIHFESIVEEVEHVVIVQQESSEESSPPSPEFGDVKKEETPKVYKKASSEVHQKTITIEHCYGLTQKDDPFQSGKSFPYFSFPTDPTRRKQWLEHCGNPDLYKLPDEMLRRKKVCAIHFNERYFKNLDFKNRLVFDAIPLHFQPDRNMDNSQEMLLKREIQPKVYRKATWKGLTVGEDLPLWNKAPYHYKKKQKELEQKPNLEGEGPSTSRYQASVAADSSNFVPKAEDTEAYDAIRNVHEEVVIKSEIDSQNDFADTEMDAEDTEMDTEEDTTADDNLIPDESQNYIPSHCPSAIISRWRATIAEKARENLLVSEEGNATVVSLNETDEVKTIAPETIYIRTPSVPVEVRKSEPLVVPTTDLCVLCAKDISKLRRRFCVEKDADLILGLTGINIFQYPISPNSCNPCRKSLSIVKSFQKQVREAKALLSKKLEHYAVNEIEFASVAPDNEVLPHLIEVLQSTIKVETPDVNMQEMHVITEPIIDNTDKILPAPFKNCNGCGQLFKDLTAHDCPVKPAVTEPVVEEDKPYNTRPQKVDHDTLLKRESAKSLCTICGKRYFTNSYTAHLKSHVGFTSCKICGELVRVASLKLHLHDHRKNEKFICSVCGKIYSQLSTLAKHSVVHGEKQHRCNVCGVSFHYGHYLRRHLRSHSGEKPFPCSYCDKSFSTVWNLHQHRRLHTNEKPYKCRLCPAAYRHNVVLKSHLKNSHTAQEIAASGQNDVAKSNSKSESEDLNKSGNDLQCDKSGVNTDNNETVGKDTAVDNSETVEKVTAAENSETVEKVTTADNSEL